MKPAPMPLPTETKTTCACPRAAPNLTSDQALALPSLSTVTGRPTRPVTFARSSPLRAGGRGGAPQFLDDAAALVDDPGSYLGAPDINPDRQAHAGILPEVPAPRALPRPLPRT